MKKQAKNFVVSSVVVGGLIGTSASVLINANKLNNSFDPSLYETNFKQNNTANTNLFGQQGQGDENFDQLKNDNSASDTSNDKNQKDENSDQANDEQNQEQTGDNLDSNITPPTISIVDSNVTSGNTIPQQNQSTIIINPTPGIIDPSGAGSGNILDGNNQSGGGLINPPEPSKPPVVYIPVDENDFHLGMVDNDVIFVGVKNEAEGNVINIPDNVTIIGMGSIGTMVHESTLVLNIPASVKTITSIEMFSTYYPNLESVSVDPYNENFSSVDGIIYNKEGTELIYVPPQKTEIKAYSKTVKSIKDNALKNSLIRSLDLPSTMQSINDYSFAGSLIEEITINSPLSLTKNALSIESLKSIKCKSGTPPTLIDKQINFYSKNGNSIISSISIEVPDSINNEIYYYYLSTWGSGLINSYSRWKDNIIDIIKTASGYYDKQLICDDAQNWYSHNGTVLEYISALTHKYDCLVPTSSSGEISLTKNSFSNLPDLENIVLDHNINELPNDVFENLDHLKTIKCVDSEMVINPQARSDWSGITIYCEDIDAFMSQNDIERFSHLQGVVKCYSNQENEKDISTIYIKNQENEYELVNVSENYTGEFTLNNQTSRIHNGALHDTTSLTRFIIQTGLKEIGESAFENSQVTSINLNDCYLLSRIEQKAFYHCQNLFKTGSGESGGGDGDIGVLSLEDDIYLSSLTYLGDYAFADTGVRTVDLSRCVSLPSLGEHTFEDCTSLVTFNYSSTISELSNYLFCNDTSLLDVIPYDRRGTKSYSSLSKIGQYTFANAGVSDAALDLYLFTGLKTIDDYAFFNTKYQEIWLDKVEIIGKSAFGCDSEKSGSLQKLVFYGNNIPIMDKTSLTGNQNPNFKIICPSPNISSFRSYLSRLDRRLAGLLTSTINNSVKRSKAVRGPGKVETEIWELTDEKYIVVTSIVGTIINYNVSIVNEIRKDAILNSNKIHLQSVTINPRQLDEGLFKGYTNLSSVVLGDQLKAISNEAFMNCSSLSSIVMGSSIESIGSSAFKDCLSLTTFTLPEKVEEIGESAFDGDINLTQLTFNKVPKTIGQLFKESQYGDVVISIDESLVEDLKVILEVNNEELIPFINKNQ